MWDDDKEPKKKGSGTNGGKTGGCVCVAGATGR